MAMQLSYNRTLASKYLISGPAPIGRILNYIKRIKENDYVTSYRGGLNNPNNLDNWTVCFIILPII